MESICKSSNLLWEHLLLITITNDHCHKYEHLSSLRDDDQLCAPFTAMKIFLFAKEWLAFFYLTVQCLWTKSLYRALTDIGRELARTMQGKNGTAKDSRADRSSNRRHSARHTPEVDALTNRAISSLNDLCFVKPLSHGDLIVSGPLTVTFF